jgi:hypothetical protein
MTKSKSTQDIFGEGTDVTGANGYPAHHPHFMSFSLIRDNKSNILPINGYGQDFTTCILQA